MRNSKFLRLFNFIALGVCGALFYIWWLIKVDVIQVIEPSNPGSIVLGPISLIVFPLLGYFFAIRKARLLSLGLVILLVVVLLPKTIGQLNDYWAKNQFEQVKAEAYEEVKKTVGLNASIRVIFPGAGEFRCKGVMVHANTGYQQYRLFWYERETKNLTIVTDEMILQKISPFLQNMRVTDLRPIELGNSSFNITVEDATGSRKGKVVLDPCQGTIRGIYFGPQPYEDREKIDTQNTPLVP